MKTKFFEIFKKFCNDNENRDVVALMKQTRKYVIDNKSSPPSSLKYYQIIKMLGKGSFGKVFLGLHKMTNRLCALKCIKKSHFKDEKKKKIL